MHAGFKGAAASFLALAAAGCAGIPETGEGVSRVDERVRAFMARWNVPGVALAVVEEGRLVAARGYGYADPGSDTPVRPDTPFRIASASKPVTGIAVMRLVEAGRLGLDERVFGGILRDYPEDCPGDPDPRLDRITVEDLLIHASGWDTAHRADPMFNAARIARRAGYRGLEPVAAAIRHMTCRGLAFEPGTRFAYENINYAVLGRVIEAVSGRSYEAFVREEVFAPLGVTGARVGRSERSGRLPGEAVYVARGTDRRRVRAPAGGVQVPLHYGGYDLRAMDSHGGWVASAVDLARLMAGVDGRPGVPDILSSAAIERMGANPGPPVQDPDARFWYALGWYRTRDGHWFHDGSLPGAASYMHMAPDGLLYAALANTRHPNPDFAEDFRATLRDAVEGAGQWPDHDLFRAYGFPPDADDGAADP